MPSDENSSTIKETAMPFLIAVRNQLTHGELTGVVIDDLTCYLSINMTSTLERTLWCGHVGCRAVCISSSTSPETLLDNKSCQWYRLFVLDLQVIDDPAAATVALVPMRSRLLSELVVPASAAGLATRVGLARQKVNYHLHALEAHGLVRLVQERKWGGLTERLFVATAASYVVSPSALGPVAADPNREIDRLSASYLIALGARVVREVGDLVRRAKEAGKRLATLAVDTEVRFRSATDRAAFSNELTEAITKLVSKYHDESAPGGRAHRLVVVAHPLPQKSEPKEPS